MKTTKRSWTRWAPLLALTALLAACGAAVAPDPAATRAPEPGPAPGPAPNPYPAPAPAQASCEDSAIRLLDGGAGFHGAIVADTLHWGGATAPATCTYPTAQPLPDGASNADGRTAQVQQSRYYLIVIRYPGGNRLYVLSRRADGTRCVVDTNDECIAQVTDLPDDFDLEELPEDVAPIIPAGRPAPPTVSPSPGGDETPPAPGPPPGDDETPPAPSPPPGDGAPPGDAGSRQPRDGATGVSRYPTLRWPAVTGAVSYLVYLSITKDFTPSTKRGSPIETTNTYYGDENSGYYVGYDTLYYWRVDAKTESGAIRGDVWSFTTKSIVAAPTDPQPRDGATGVTVDGPLLSWAASPGAAGYRVSFGLGEEDPHSGGSWTSLGVTTSTFVSLPTSWDGRSVRTRAGTYQSTKYNLEHETLYSWSVFVYDDSGNNRSPTWSFTTAPAPPATEPPPAPAPAPPAATDTLPGAASTPQPSDGGTGVTFSRPLLSWAAAPRASRYDLHWGTTQGLAADAGLGTPIKNIESTSWRIRNVADLAGATTYYWRVDARNASGTTKGPVWSFTTATGTAAPGAVGNPNPSDGATDVTVVEPLVRWSAGARATSYDVYWGTTRNLAADAYLDTPHQTNGTMIRLTLSNAPPDPADEGGDPTAHIHLARGTTYYWRVDARNAGGTTKGPVWSFTTVGS